LASASKAARTAAPLSRPSAPIFLHSSWRTASTYVWAKFRALPQTYCYFEPLSEDLASVTPWLLDEFVPWSFARHPQLDAPYWEEFRPLLGKLPGVPLYPAELTYRRYRADRSAHLPELEAYFGRLLDYADARAKIPVFGCVRTSLRLDWFRHHLPGVHLFIARDHRRQFLSYLRQAANGNPYFLERVWVILGNNRTDPAFAPLHQVIDIPDFDGPPRQCTARYAMRARTAEANELYRIFYYLHLLTLRDLGTNYDLLIDIDKVSCDPAAIDEVESKIAALTGMAISFADCKIETYDEQLSWSSPFFAALEAEVEDLFRQTCRTKADGGSPSARSARQSEGSATVVGG
jgi:hypothetical protein